MFKEWIRTLCHYFKKAYGILGKNINGKPFPKWRRIAFLLSFWVLSGVIVWFIPQGFSEGFIDYIKDIFAIFVGFFVTVLCFVFDKLDTKQLLSTEQENNVTAEKRADSQEVLKIKQEHNYTVRFFYTIGLIILFSATVILLLIPNIFWAEWLNMDMEEYCIIQSWKDLNWNGVLLFLHLSLCLIYRVLVVLMTIKVFYYTTYSVSSLLQVLINKKKLETWN